MELLVEVDVIDGFGGGDDAFSALVVEIERVDWVVEVESDEWGVGFRLEDVGAVLPEVKVAVWGADDCAVPVTSQVHYLATADNFAPHYFKVPVPHNHQLSFGRAA